MQEVQLERSWLAEEFYLENVIRQILNKGYKILHSEWYYQHVTVLPMWESHTELTYQVNIPTLSKEKYLYFALYYVGVPCNEEVFYGFGHDKYFNLFRHHELCFVYQTWPPQHLLPVAQPRPCSVS